MHFELRGDLISFGGQCVVFHNPRPKVMDQSRYFEFTDGDVVDLKLNKRGCLEFTFESIQKGFIKVKLRDLQFSYSKKFWEWQIDELKSYHELVKDKLKSFKAQQALINQRQNARKENLRGEPKKLSLAEFVRCKLNLDGRL